MANDCSVYLFGGLVYLLWNKIHLLDIRLSLLYMTHTVGSKKIYILNFF